MARPIFPSKRKSTGYKPRAETGLTHESREAVHEPDGDGRRKKAKKTTPDASGAVGGGGKQKFACPYFKRNPRKYRNWTSCPGPGWEEVHRVKTHLYRRHALPLQCPRCWDVFKTDTVLQAHLQSDPPCTVKQNSVPHEGFTKDQEKRLRSRKKAHADMTDEDKWNEIYQILFPDDDPDAIPGPYYDTFDDEDGPTPASASGSGDLDDYASFVRREMPALVRRELEVLFKNESRDVQDRLGLQVEQIVLDLQPRLMGLYKQSQIPLSEYGPAQQQADYGVVANVSTPISTSGLSSGCGQGVSPCSGVSPGYVTSPAPVGMLTPESTTGYTGDVPYYGAFLTPNMPAMAASAGMGGGHPLYTADSALLGTGGADFNLDTNQFSGVDELNWDDAFGRILDPEVFMPRQAEVFGGGYGF
ncbi:hypothetical protein QBC44DRAFT_248364 [Cladorrhinum sp. PSN332]|nr:hypothetical protein QBC44DRAFT_248364 [Cladorrhinum sp. PSN332]